MSTDEDGLTERDRLFYDELETQSETEPSPTDDSVLARRNAITATKKRTSSEIHDLRAELESQREETKYLLSLINRLQEQIEGDASLTGSTTIEKYSSMDEDDRETLLSTSEWRAVEIYNHWDELAWKAGGTLLMETQARANAKNQPSKIKYRLEKHFDKSLQANEIYRAMKAVARLSGGEESTDSDGRTHIEGGDFEYHVVPTADNSGTRRVLEEALE